MIKPIGEFTFIKILGKGSFGEVFLTKKENSSQLFATKKIPFSNLTSHSFAKYLDNEISIMRKLDHKNIVKLHKLIRTKNNLYIIMDYLNGGNLQDYLIDYQKLHHKPFPQKMIQYFVKQIVDGLIHIHSKDILHRDIKLENILLNYPPNIKEENRDYTQAEVKIIDFGLSTQLNHYRSKDGDKKTLAQSTVGTPMNMDPIILNKYDKYGGIKKYQLYDEKCDIWSLGAITYEMLTGQNLFKANDLDDLIEQVKKGNYYLNVKDLSSEILSFLNCMLQYNPKERLSAEELAKHQFLTHDADNFTPADVSQIDYKVINGRLIISIFNNNTIKGLFPFKPENMLNSYAMNLDEISKRITKEKTEPKPIPKQVTQNPRNINIENNNFDMSRRSNTMNNVLFRSANINNTINKNDLINFSHKNSLNLANTNLNLNRINSNNSKNIQKNKKYKIKFQVEIDDNFKENIQLNISFLINESNILEKKINLTAENNYKYDWMWEIDYNIIKNIDINNEYLIVYVEIVKANSKETFRSSVEKIILGKPVFLKLKNFINFNLTPQ